MSDNNTRDQQRLHLQAHRHLQLALKTRDHMTAVRFVMDHGETVLALMDEADEMDSIKRDLDEALGLLDEANQISQPLLMRRAAWGYK